MRVIIFIISLTLTTHLTSQKLDQSVISADGGISKFPGGNIQWTLGEPAIEGLMGVERSYTEGFNQPFLDVQQVDPDSFKPQTQNKHGGLDSDNDISIYPNPVSSVLSIDLQLEDFKEILLVVSNADGGQLINSITASGTGRTELDLSSLASGLYLLHFRTKDGKQIASYKISKIH